MSNLKNQDPDIFGIINSEVQRQNDFLELIASENFTSRAVLEAVGSALTNKYAEGYPGKRYYGGCIHVDEAENLAIDRAKQLFKADYANVQPHSGSSSNMGVYLAMLNPGDCIMGLDLSHGGHLTHGSKVSFSGKLYNAVTFHVKKEDGLIDFDDLGIPPVFTYADNVYICLVCTQLPLLDRANKYGGSADFVNSSNRLLNIPLYKSKIIPSLNPSMEDLSFSFANL